MANKRKDNSQNLVKKKVPEKIRGKVPIIYKILLGVLILNLITYFFIRHYIYVTIVIDVILLFVWSDGWKKSCPKCKKYWSLKLVNRTNFGTHTEFNTVRRSITHRDARGNAAGRSSFTDTIPVTKTTIQNHYICKNCSHSWSGKIRTV